MTAARPEARARSLVGVILCASLGVSMLVISMRSRSAAQPIDDGSAYISRARSAALTHDFGGEVELVWIGPDGQKRASMAVRSEDGILSLGSDEQIVIQGATRFSRGESGWETLWTQRPDRPVRAASEKWELSVRRGPVIAGRATREVAAADRDSGRVRERRYFDASTGLLLRREQFDDAGRRVRYASYTRITLLPQIPVAAAPTVPTKTDPHQPKSIDKVPAGFEIPSGIGNGFRLNGAYRREDGTLQLFYSDGLFSASVFQEEGTLDRDDLEPGGVDRDVDGHFVHEYDVPAGTVLVWERDGLVFTSVSDAPADELEEMVLSFGGDPGVVHRALDYVLGPFGW
jgi:hypothetical protein